LPAVLALSAGVLYLVQRSKRHDGVSPDAVLDVAAEIERDISRAQMHLTRLSDESEIRIGNELAEGYRPVPGTINLRLGAVRRLAYEAAD
jgi:hypothetical protein